MAYLLAAIALLGHVALCIAAINRMHSSALPYRMLRVINLLWYVFFFGVPILVACWLAAGMVTGPFRSPTFAAISLLTAYAAVACVAALIVGVSFFRRQRLAATANCLLANHTRTIDIAERLGEPPVGDLLTRLALYLPGNDILRLSVHEKSLALARLPEELVGFSIVHLSDLHFTGQLTPHFFHEVIRQANQLSGDVVAITGDIIDKSHCLPWIPQILGSLRSRYGNFFVLGNHDRRLGKSRAIRKALTDAGLTDLGGTWRLIEVRGRPIILAGNELPWYVPAADLRSCPTTHVAGRPFRIALAHSPDQFDWARDNDIDLMLAGHTHGGQFCFPLVGPLLSPSRYGVRFASGAFYREPTVMHVSRGVSATRPYRLNCSPELAKLVLSRVSDLQSEPRCARVS